MAAGCASATGLISSFFVIQFEWHSAHPWPESDVLYVTWAAVRCSLLGGTIGYTISVAFVMLAGRGPHANPDQETAVDLGVTEVASTQSFPSSCNKPSDAQRIACRELMPLRASDALSRAGVCSVQTVNGPHGWTLASTRLQSPGVSD
jgi:hypothetical protein